MPIATPSPSDLRAWAQNAGLSVAERGRLKPEILAAWQAAHSGSGATQPRPDKKPAPAKVTTAKVAARKSTSSNRSTAKQVRAKPTSVGKVRGAAGPAKGSAPTPVLAEPAAAIARSTPSSPTPAKSVSSKRAATTKASQGQAVVPSPVPKPHQEAVPSVVTVSQDPRVADLEAAVHSLTVRVAELEAAASATSGERKRFSRKA